MALCARRQGEHGARAAMLHLDAALRFWQQFHQRRASSVRGTGGMRQWLVAHVAPGEGSRRAVPAVSGLRGQALMADQLCVSSG